MDPHGDPGTNLDQGIRRIQTALGPGAPSNGLVAPVPTRAETRALERARRRRSRYEEQAQRWGQWRSERHEDDSEHGLGTGIVQGIAALAIGGFALVHPNLWWLFFPAVGFGTTSARQISRAVRGWKTAAAGPAAPAAPTALPAPASASAEGTDRTLAGPAAEPGDTRFPAITLRLTRVDDICRKMLAELKSAPALVRELLRKPEETVEALKAASHELARRERELRAAVTEEDAQRLQQERTGLEARVASETDDVVRGRLASALESLDAQLAHRRELGTLASRIEAEGTRILYSLENLRAKVLRASVADSASPDLAGEGLREGLEQLSREMDAVATALEEVHGTESVRRAASAPRPIPQRTQG
ncbi:MAG: hypothetical protein ABIT01_01065 [Thermoanaerobaculia bacterium]